MKKLFVYLIAIFMVVIGINVVKAEENYDYNKLLNDYEEKYGVLNINSSYLNNTPFGWEEESWPWDRRKR